MEDSTKPWDDLIKRRYAIYALCNGCKKISQCFNDNGEYSWCNKGMVMRFGIQSADRPQGVWIYTDNPLRLDDEWACSRCGNISFVRTNFCDRCGAKMKGADDD